MQSNFIGGDGGGSGVFSSGTSCESGMSTVSRDDGLVSSSMDSSCPDESELELGLALSLGGDSCKVEQARYARILTAMDFPSVASSSSSSSTSSVSSSSTLSRANVTVGTKRNADSAAAANSASHVVGWPPIRANRMNSLVNQLKLPSTEDCNSIFEKDKSKNAVVQAERTNDMNNKKERGSSRGSLFVKVNMDGIPIGRKVNLNAHRCYETLAWALEIMFDVPTTTVNMLRSGEENEIIIRAPRFSKLLDGSSEFVLIYEDREGDWMLVGDIPWRMFLCSVKRLRIMRTTEVDVLDPRLGECDSGQRGIATPMG